MPGFPGPSELRSGPKVFIKNLQVPVEQPPYYLRNRWPGGSVLFPRIAPSLDYDLELGLQVTRFRAFGLAWSMMSRSEAAWASRALWLALTRN